MKSLSSFVKQHSTKRRPSLNNPGTHCRVAGAPKVSTTCGSDPGSRRAQQPRYEKNTHHLFPTAKTRANCSIRCSIDTYDVLVSPTYRRFAQIALSASNESPNDASAVEQAAEAAPGRSRLEFSLTAPLSHRLGATCPRPGGLGGRSANCRPPLWFLKLSPEANTGS